MTRIIRYLPMIAVAFAGLAIMVYALWPVPVRVEVASVTRGPLRVTVDEDGKTRVKDRYVVSAPLSGQLGRIELDEGDEIEANQSVLAVIQPTDPALLDARLLSEAESRVKAAEAAEQQAVARLDVASEARQLAQDHFRRAKSLVGTKAISQTEFDMAEHEERITAGSLRAAQFGLQVAKYELGLAQAAFVRTRPLASGGTDHQRLEVRSPVDGQVLRVIQKSAAVVAPGQSLLEVGNTKDLEMEIDVLSADAARIRPGARLFIEHWGGETPLQGRVRRIEPSGFTKISALGVEEQRVNVIADFDEPPGRLSTLGDAFRVEARIVVWESYAALKVPSGALFRQGDAWAVFTVKSRYAELRTVKIGRNNGQEAEVLDGLCEGDIVVTYPSDNIHDGTAVLPAENGKI